MGLEFPNWERVTSSWSQFLKYAKPPKKVILSYGRGPWRLLIMIFVSSSQLTWFQALGFSSTCQLSKLCEKIIQNFIQKTLKNEWQHNRMNGYTKGFGHSKLKTTDLWIDAVKYCKIPKISPEVYTFERPFLRGLLLEGLIFGRAYARREICLSKSIKVA